MKMLMAHFGHGWHGFSGEGLFFVFLVVGLFLLTLFAMSSSGQEKK